MKTKYDARHQLKQLGWNDQELDAIGLTLLHEGKVTIPPRHWGDLPSYPQYGSPYHY